MEYTTNPYLWWFIFILWIFSGVAFIYVVNATHYGPVTWKESWKRWKNFLKNK